MRFMRLNATGRPCNAVSLIFFSARYVWQLTLLVGVALPSVDSIWLKMWPEGKQSLDGDLSIHGKLDRCSVALPPGVGERGEASQYACASRRESPYSQHDSQECRAAGAGRDDFADGPVVGPFRDRHMGYCDWRGSCNSGAGLTHSSAGRRESGGVLLGVPENAIVIASGGHST